MKSRFSTSSIQATLWACMIAITAAIVLTAVYTNTTLQAIEKNLPKTLFSELNSLSAALDELNDVVFAVKLARISNSQTDLEQLRDKIEAAQETIVELRETYVANNMVNASTFHAVVAPAIADLQIWLAEGISGFAPDSPVTLGIVETRIADAYRKARLHNSESQVQAQAILDQQVERLGLFQTSVTILFLLILVVAAFLIVLLVRQSFLITRDINTQGQLRRQHNLLENLLENLPLGIAVWDKDKNIVHLNHRFTEITGYDRNDMPRLHDWPKLAYPDPTYYKLVRKHWKSLNKAQSVGEYKVSCKDGRVKDIEFRATFLQDSRVINTLNDVTERNLKEEALRESRRIEARARKMESLGLLAGGVAHDLNNILSGIVSYPELILMDLTDDDKLKKPIEIMRDSGQKAAAIVQDLLTVARGVAIAKERLNINDIIRDYLNSPDFSLQKKYHPDISIDVSLADDLLPIMGSRVHIRKILMNLVSNGCEAINRPGRVLISTSNCYLDTAFQGYEDIEEGEFTLLTVADQGSGISESDLERIFEPFYSKKVMGRSGTGLGLAVVWNVVQDHHGYINVSSSTEGTTFNIYFPVTKEEERQIQESPHSIVDLQGNGELILVVDDISSQRLINSNILEKLGYRTETAASGEAAIAFVKEHPVDLLLLDMIMDPGISGRETYQQILKLYPRQKAIIVSGYAETDDVKKTLEMGANSFLKKPLKIHELGAAIKEALA